MAGLDRHVLVSASSCFPPCQPMFETLTKSVYRQLSHSSLNASVKRLRRDNIHVIGVRVLLFLGSNLVVQQA